MRGILSISVLCLWAASAVLLPGGCAGKQAAPSVATLDAPPPDFTVAFTVLARTTRRNLDVLPRPERPARFVMETDWVLRAYSGTSVTDAAFPHETRQLTDAQVRELWTDLRTAGLLDPQHPGLVGRPPAVSDLPSLPSPTWVLTYAALGKRRTILLDAASRRAAEPLLTRFCDLAWMAQ